MLRHGVLCPTEVSLKFDCLSVKNFEPQSSSDWLNKMSWHFLGDIFAKKSLKTTTTTLTEAQDSLELRVVPTIHDNIQSLGWETDGEAMSIMFYA